jgi:L-fuculose-phosphate aldolase
MTTAAKSASDWGDEERHLRGDIVRVSHQMALRGLNKGTSGNVSARCGLGLLVTPSGVPADHITPANIVFIDADGAPEPGAPKPSSEWRLHAGLYARRADVNAVVHCHSRHATILACVGRPIPSFHYMVGVSGKSIIPVAPYQTFGTPELAAGVVDTMDGGYACLMANHGQIVGAVSLDKALSIAEEVEEQAAVYWGTLAIGGPNLLTDEQMGRVFTQFKDYGQK